MPLLIPCQIDAADGDDPPRVRKWMTALLVIGIAARVIRFILRFPLWEDECFLSYNLIGRDFAEVAGPLVYQQVAPPLFLWVQLAVVRVLGFSELPLRLFPFVCSIVSLALFAHVARLLLRGTALLLAVGLFAVSYPGIRFAGEAKQYGIDLAVSVLIITLTVHYLRDGRPRWLWLLAACMPAVVLVSYPSVFIAGAASLVMLPALGATNHRRHWLAWVAMNGAMIAAFTLTLWLAIAHQSVTPFMQNAWRAGFLPVADPKTIPLWLITTFTGDALAFPVGSGNGGSTFTFILCLAGLFAFWRGGRGRWCAALLLPLILHLIASAMGRYPLGVHMKFSMHLMPVICLLAGTGGAALLRMHRAPGPRRFATVAGLSLLVLIGLGAAARDVVHPYKTLSDQRARAFARWVWFELPHEGEVACLRTDLGIDFSHATFDELSWSAMYLVNQHIASPRLREGVAPQWANVSRERPLYVFEFRDGDKPYDDAAQKRWLAEMTGKYRLDSQQSFPMARYDKHERRLIKMDHVRMYRFVPKRTVPVAQPR